jgi:hypothetical protein
LPADANLRNRHDHPSDHRSRKGLWPHRSTKGCWRCHAEIKSATEEAKTLPVAGSSTAGIIAHLDEIFLNLGRDIHKDESTLVAYSTEKWAELKAAIWPAKKEVVEAAKNTDTTATDKVAADTNAGEPIPSVAPVGSVPEPGETVDETHLPQD